jgi:cytochrome c oxidase cbb3-type subunit 4
MDIMDMRVVITLLSFTAFLGIVWWAYSSRQEDRFDEAANLPFADDEMQQRTINHSAELSGASLNDTNTIPKKSDEGLQSVASSAQKEMPHG